MTEKDGEKFVSLPKALETIKELRTRMAELEKELENDNSEVCRQRDVADSERRNAEIRCTNLRMENDIRKEREDKLQTRLSTLLKASEGMEKALEWEPMDCGDNSCHFAKERGGMRTNGGCRCHRGHPNILKTYQKQKQALADFRAVKEKKI